MLKRSTSPSTRKRWLPQPLHRPLRNPRADDRAGGRRARSSAGSAEPSSRCRDYPCDCAQGRLRALEAFPETRPRITSEDSSARLADHGPQFVAKDLKAFIRVKGMDHVRTSPYYPQSNGKLERWHKSLKSECIRPKTPLNLDEARRLVSAYVDHYNQHRLHSAIGYITPADKLAGRAPEILENREKKLHKARAQRAENRRLQSERPVRVVS